ncbi:TPA: hypothetical protein ACH3X2_005982 [Trebouxia sp. C0005]|nr:MAG: hypothetical protein FRX49_00706 [Trebouxia sp. A1-2]
MLLSNHANVNAADNAGIMPQMPTASIPSDTHTTPLIELLCQNGARAQLRDTKGETALMKAAANSFITAANVSLQASCCIDLQDNAGYKALLQSLKPAPSHMEQRLTAEGFSADSMVWYLMQSGADVSFQDIAGHSALIG